MRVPVLRPLSLGEVLDTSFGIYRTLFAPLLVVSALTQIVPLAVSVYTAAAGGLAQLPAMWALSLGLSVVLGAVGTAASTFMVAETYLGTGLTWQEAFLRSTPFMGRLISASFLVSFLMAIGFILLIIPSIIIGCGLILTTPALVLEDIPRTTDAMGRAWALSRGFRLKIFGAMLVAIVLLFLPNIALGILFGGGAAIDPTAPLSLMSMIAQSILQILIYPFFYVVTTVLYYDLRVRKEGLDLEMLASALQQG